MDRLHLITHSLFVLLLCSSLSTHAQQSPFEVGNISVIGNEVTQERYILRWAGISAGQLLNQNELEQARQRIENTGLFKRVTMSQQPATNNQPAELTIELEEKIYTLVIPRLGRNGDGDVTTGLRLQMDNLNGANQQLKITAETEDEVNGDQSDEFSVRYELPLFDAPYKIGWAVETSEKSTTRESFDNIEYRDVFALSVSRKYPLSTLDRDLQVSLSFGTEDFDYTQPYPAASKHRSLENTIALAWVSNTTA